MDRQKLRSLVFDKTGIKIDVDDPLFALVALNEAVLADTVERHLALLDNAARELALQAQAAADGTPRPLPPPLPPLSTVESAPAASSGFTRAERRLIGAAAGAAFFGALLALATQTLFATPPPAVTPAQVLALVQGEKLARAVQKLDQKNRDLIQAELQKP